jgi:hypothetical protein
MLDSGLFNDTALDRATIATWQVEVDLAVLVEDEEGSHPPTRLGRAGQRIRHGLPGHAAHSALHINTLREDLPGVLSISGTVGVSARPWVQWQWVWAMEQHGFHQLLQRLLHYPMRYIRNELMGTEPWGCAIRQGDF